MASTLGADNPLRYRGYVYDSETWFYYLQSRYYSFEWGKFISADAFSSTGQGFTGNNMFAYCLNNPVCRKDIPGTTSVDILDDGDSNLLDNDRSIAGSKMGNGGSSGGMGKLDGYTTPKAEVPRVPSNTDPSGNISNLKYPGNDPTKCNIPGFEWRGSGSPVSGHGNYVNMQTGEWLHPDLNHGPPIGPHWDYGVRGSVQTFRIFPDGSWCLK